METTIDSVGRVVVPKASAPDHRAARKASARRAATVDQPRHPLRPWPLMARGSHRSLDLRLAALAAPQASSA